MTYQPPKIGVFPFKIIGEVPIEETNMSQTWLAVTTEASPPRQVVIKIAARRVSPYFSRNQDAIIIEENWLKQLQARTRHSGIVELISVVPQAKQPIYSGKTSDPGEPRFIVLGYLSGGTLKEFLASSRRLPPIYALHIAKRLAESIAFVHELGCVHMDIKPDNVMFRDVNGVGSTVAQVKPVLIDFGIARRAGEENFVGGVNQWLAPECVKAKRAHARIRIDPAMDIYPLGLLLHYMLTGQHPEEFAHDLRSKRRITPEVLGNVSPAVAQRLDALVGAMLHHAPAQRPSSSQITRSMDELMKQLTPAEVRPARRFGWRGWVYGAVGSVMVVVAALLLRSVSPEAGGGAPGGLQPQIAPVESAPAAGAGEGELDTELAAGTLALTPSTSTVAPVTVASLAERASATPHPGLDEARSSDQHSDGASDSAPAVVDAEPTSTKVPTRKPVATFSPTPEPPLPAAPATAEATSTPTAATNPFPSPAPTQPPVARRVTLFSPMNDISSSGRVDFRWTADFSLSENERFEVAYWDPANGNALEGEQGAYGFGPATTDTFLQVDLQQYNRYNAERFASGRTYIWAVRICFDASCSAFQWVSEPRSIRYELGSSESETSDGSGT